MTPLRWIPRLIYGHVGDLTTLDFSLPQRFWNPGEGAIAGYEEVTVSGLPVSDIARYDYSIVVTWRFTDDELPAVMDAIQWMQRFKSVPVTLRLEHDRPTTEYLVYLSKPAVGERIKAQRDTGDFTVWQITLTFRSADARRIFVNFLDPEYIDGGDALGPWDLARDMGDADETGPLHVDAGSAGTF